MLKKVTIKKRPRHIKICFKVLFKNNIIPKAFYEDPLINISLGKNKFQLKSKKLKLVHFIYLFMVLFFQGNLNARYIFYLRKCNYVACTILNVSIFILKTIDFVSFFNRCIFMRMLPFKKKQRNMRKKIIHF